MSLCRHCNAIDITTLVWNSRDSKENKPHHRTFRELKQSAESCPLCALFVEKLEERNAQYDYDQTYEVGDYRGIYYTGQHESDSTRIKEADPKFLIGLTMMCMGGIATVDLYASEGWFLSNLSFEKIDLYSDSQIVRLRLPKTFLEDRSGRSRISAYRNAGFSTVSTIINGVLREP